MTECARIYRDNHHQIIVAFFSNFSAGRRPTSSEKHLAIFAREKYCLIIYVGTSLVKLTNIFNDKQLNNPLYRALTYDSIPNETLPSARRFLYEKKSRRVFTTLRKLWRNETHAKRCFERLNFQWFLRHESHAQSSTFILNRACSAKDKLRLFTFVLSKLSEMMQLTKLRNWEEKYFASLLRVDSAVADSSCIIKLSFGDSTEVPSDESAGGRRLRKTRSSRRLSRIVRLLLQRCSFLKIRKFSCFVHFFCWLSKCGCSAMNKKFEKLLSFIAKILDVWKNLKAIKILAVREKSDADVDGREFLLQNGTRAWVGSIAEQLNSRTESSKLVLCTASHYGSKKSRLRHRAP